MFEKIVIRQAVDAAGTLDRGLLAESILFYGQVHLIVDRRMLLQLCRDLGASTLLRLLRSGFARATFIREMPVIITETTGITVHSSAQIQTGAKGEKRLATLEEEIEEFVRRSGGESRYSKRKAYGYIKAQRWDTKRTIIFWRIFNRTSAK